MRAARSFCAPSKEAAARPGGASAVADDGLLSSSVSKAMVAASAPKRSWRHLLAL